MGRRGNERGRGDLTTGDGDGTRRKGQGRRESRRDGNVKMGRLGEGRWNSAAYRVQRNPKGQ